MDPNRNEQPDQSLIDRFRRSWCAPVAAVGALAAFSSAFFRARPEPRAAVPEPRPSALLPVLPSPTVSEAADLPRTYAAALTIGPSRPFNRSLAGVAVGSADSIYALGDSEVRVFDVSGGFIRGWRAPEWAVCIAAAGPDRVLLGGGAHVEITDTSGRRIGAFDTGNAASITAIKAFGQHILVADSAARLIFRLDAAGRRLGDIGSQGKTGHFMLPNRMLDFDVDGRGVVLAGDSGRHRVTLWDIDGQPLGSFGKFGMSSPADFVGCCNPVDIAWTPDGNIVTAEKMVARVKVYEPGGKLLALIGPENFDPRCTSIRLAVDSRGRILAADPVRRQIRVFAPSSTGAAR